MNFNLLPYARKHLNQEQVEWIVIACLILLPIVIMILINVEIKHEINLIQNESNAISDEIQSIKSMSETREPNESNAVYENYLTATINFWKLLSRLAEQSVCVTSVTRHKNKLIIEGLVRSRHDLEKYVNKLSQSRLLSQIDVYQYSHDKLQYGYHYHLRLGEANELQASANLK